jgi:hypothetical protein
MIKRCKRTFERFFFYRTFVRLFFFFKILFSPKRLFLFFSPFSPFIIIIQLKIYVPGGIIYVRISNRITPHQFFREVEGVHIYEEIKKITRNRNWYDSYQFKRFNELKERIVSVEVTRHAVIRWNQRVGPNATKNQL